MSPLPGVPSSECLGTAEHNMKTTTPLSFRETCKVKEVSINMGPGHLKKHELEQSTLFSVRVPAFSVLGVSVAAQQCADCGSQDLQMSLGPKIQMAEDCHGISP